MHWQVILALVLGVMSCWYAHVAGMKYAGMATIPQAKTAAIVRTIGSVLLIITAIVFAQIS